MAKGANEAGTIVLARHGEPALSRKTRLNATDYAAWWAVYEETGLAPGQTPPDTLLVFASTAGVILSSTRVRSIETARLITNRDVAADPDLIEAPLPPPHWPRWVRLTPRLWGFFARFWWWWFNHHDGQETKRQAQKRSDLVARRLVEHAEKGENVIVIAHGFFNTMVGLSLRRLGWKLTEGKGYKYWSFRRFERR